MEREAEEERQSIATYKLECEEERARRMNELAIMSTEHEARRQSIELKAARHEEELDAKSQRRIEEAKATAELERLRSLSDMGVDITELMVAQQYSGGKHTTVEVRNKDAPVLLDTEMSSVRAAVDAAVTQKWRERVVVACRHTLYR